MTDDPTRVIEKASTLSRTALKGRALDAYNAGSNLAKIWQKLADPSSAFRNPIVPGLISKGLTVVIGASGARKTTALIGIAIRLAAGLPITTPGRSGPVLFFTAEDRDGAEKRGVAAALLLDVPLATLPIHFLSLPSLIHAPTFAEEVIAIGQRFAEQSEADLAAVFIDTLGASFGSVSLNDDGPMLAAANAGLTIAERLGCATVISHHPPKSGTGERGSLVLRDRADAVIRCELGRPLTTIATVEKNRNGPDGAAFELVFVEHTMLFGEQKPLSALVLDSVTPQADAGALALASTPSRSTVPWRPSGDTAAILTALEQAASLAADRQIERQVVRPLILTALQRRHRRDDNAAKSALSAGLKLLSENGLIGLDKTWISVRNPSDIGQVSDASAGAVSVRKREPRSIRAGSRSDARPDRRKPGRVARKAGSAKAAKDGGRP